MKKLIIVMYVIMFGELFVVPYMGYLYQKNNDMVYMWAMLGSILLTFITSIGTTTLMEKYFNKAFKKMEEKESSKECPYFIEKEN